MDKVWLIISREYSTRVRKKSFLIMTLLGPLLFVGFMAAAVYLTQNDEKVYEVVLSDPDGLFGKVLEIDEFKDSPYVHFHAQEGPMSDNDFKKSTYDLKVDVVPEAIYAENLNIYYKDHPSFSVQKHISAQLEQNFEKVKLTQNNVSRETYESIKTKINLRPLDIEKTDSAQVDPEIGFIVGLVLAMIIYIFIFLYGAQVMRGVMEEKSSRIVEVIISSVRPFQLMLGKIVGVAAVGLTQFLLWIVLTSLLFSGAQLFFGDVIADPSVLIEQQMSPSAAHELQNEFAGGNEAIQEFFLLYHQSNIPFILGMFLFYFLGGYLLYGSLFAAVGSAVDSESDTQQFMIPLVMPLVFAFIVAETAISNPDGAAVFWTSIIPFTSPVVMMIKVGMMGMGFQEMDWLTIAISMILLILGFIGTTWLAARIYRVGILMHGKKVSYKELWKWLRYY
jgi:ABC-2 type transport system permease protein